MFIPWGLIDDGLHVWACGYVWPIAGFRGAFDSSGIRKKRSANKGHYIFGRAECKALTQTRARTHELEHGPNSRPEHAHKRTNSPPAKGAHRHKHTHIRRNSHNMNMKGSHHDGSH
jgi:hypothetical protein